MSSIRASVASFAFLLSACTGSVTFRSPVDFTADLDAYSNTYTQSGLVTDSAISSIACPSVGGDAVCQQIVDSAQPGSELVMRCNANLCDPEPYRFLLDLGVQDLADLADPEVSVIDRLELLRVEASRLTNTSNFDVPAFQLRWGSESASSGNLATSTTELATVPVMVQGVVGPLEVTLNDASLDALDAYIRATSTKVRFFLVTDIDLEPGQAIPAGKIELELGLIIRASGRLR